MQASCTAVARAVRPHLLRCRAAAVLRLNGHCAQQFAYATQAHTGTRADASRYSVPLFARNAYLDGLREAAARARTPDDVEHVFRQVHAGPAAELEEEGLKAVVTVLADRKDPRLLRALVDSKLFRPWYGSRYMVALVYCPLFRVMLDPYGSCPPPTDDEMHGIITELKSRGGVVTPVMARTITQAYIELGRSPHPRITEAISRVTDLPIGIDFNIAKWQLYIKDERRTRSWRDVLRTVLPHFRRIRWPVPTSTISAIMDSDVWKPSDIEEIASDLGIEVDTGVVSRAVENAIRVSGARAGMEVFQYARSRGLWLAWPQSQRLITALVAFRTASIAQPDDVSAAVDVFRRQVQHGNPARDSDHIRPLPLLSALATSIGVQRRWDTIRAILSFSRRYGVRVMPHCRRELSGLTEDIFLCSSHSAAIDILYGRSRDLAYDELLELLHTISRLRFDSAPTFPYADFVAFVGIIESCGHGLPSELVSAWISAVIHSRTHLDTPWEQRALGPPAKDFDELAVSYLRQLENGLLAEHPALDTATIRAQLMATYAAIQSAANEEDVLRCWTWIVDRNAVTQETVPYVLRASQSPSVLRTVWRDSLRQGLVPSKENWARYASRLVRGGCCEEGFEILRDEIGDDVHFRHVAVQIFLRSRQEDFERYARQLPKIWRDPRTRAELFEARAYREARGQNWYPQHYDFSI
ncbi:hypothetical protein EXIGLDRAFT_732665 [Exidia glandulosa HHB12029]|uniref:Uncharacterized protein n=1 Tax=Exidia glandulosa HHB12029 TaxID=1314781 RepID=A0A165KNZ6_EXIGL|nr:hypothetical protein EXIGLDRAFT_732665 [Exidia glandulosa HHB12029]